MSLDNVQCTMEKARVNLVNGSLQTSYDAYVQCAELLLGALSHVTLADCCHGNCESDSTTSRSPHSSQQAPSLVDILEKVSMLKTCSSQIYTVLTTFKGSHYCYRPVPDQNKSPDILSTAPLIPAKDLRKATSDNIIFQKTSPIEISRQSPSPHLSRDETSFPSDAFLAKTPSPTSSYASLTNSPRAGFENKLAFPPSSSTSSLTLPRKSRTPTNSPVYDHPDDLPYFSIVERTKQLLLANGSDSFLNALTSKFNDVKHTSETSPGPTPDSSNLNPTTTIPNVSDKSHWTNLSVETTVQPVLISFSSLPPPPPPPTASAGASILHATIPAIPTSPLMAIEHLATMSGSSSVDGLKNTSARDDSHMQTGTETEPARDQTVQNKIVQDMIHQWTTISPSISILHLHPHCTAFQLLSIDFAIFLKINPFTDFAQHRPPHQASAAIQRSTDFFNYLTRAIELSVLSVDDIHERVQVLQQWIKIARWLLTLKAYNTLKAVISALRTPPMMRLKKAWANVSKKYHVLLNAYQDLLSEQDNYNKYRSLLVNGPDSLQIVSVSNYNQLFPHPPHSILTQQLHPSGQSKPQIPEDETVLGINDVEKKDLSSTNHLKWEYWTLNGGKGGPPRPALPFLGVVIHDFTYLAACKSSTRPKRNSEASISSSQPSLQTLDANVKLAADSSGLNFSEDKRVQSVLSMIQYFQQSPPYATDNKAYPTMSTIMEPNLAQPHHTYSFPGFASTGGSHNHLKPHVCDHGKDKDKIDDAMFIRHWILTRPYCVDRDLDILIQTEGDAADLKKALFVERDKHLSQTKQREIANNKAEELASSRKDDSALSDEALNVQQPDDINNSNRRASRTGVRVLPPIPPSHISLKPLNHINRGGGSPP